MVGAGSIKIVFCIPGNNFSGRFFDCWSETIVFCLKNGIKPILSRKYSNCVYYVRNMLLGADVLRGKNQKPFNGELDYDFQMWLDSDIVFKPSQIIQLLNHDRDIVSGLYLMENGRQYAAVQNWDEEYFKKHGHFQFLSPEDTKGRGELLKVDYSGFGFMLIKRGVVESMEYPWFRPLG